jgi:glycosyltransferase involved in cell wall biosynthesis
VSIAVVIISKNEEKNIVRCLKSVDSFCDEIILVDSFSTDDTVALASKFSKVKVFQREFDDFIQQKNYANSLVMSDFILSLDADEYADATLIDFIRGKEYLKHQAIQFLRINYVGDYAVKHGLWKMDFKVRLWKKDLGQWAGSIPHEHLELNPNTKIFKSNALINHNAYKNLNELKVKAGIYAQLASQNYISKSILSLFWAISINPIFKFMKGYIILQGFRDGIFGWAIAKVSFLETFYKYFYTLKLKFQSR